MSKKSIEFLREESSLNNSCLRLAYVMKVPDGRLTKEAKVIFDIDCEDLIGFENDRQLHYSNHISLTFKGGFYKNWFHIEPLFRGKTSTSDQPPPV